ncbi:SufE family protein [Microbacter sp. GSS18]|nr:SufE family protein [Microbacter sp. GSS18]
MTASALPPQLAEIRHDFLELDLPERLGLLAEFAAGLPELPPEYAAHPDRLERVTECQSPVFIALSVDVDGGVALHARVPEEAPTTRGFAAVLAEGLAGIAVDDVEAVPDDLARDMGLDRAVSPLRLAGMAGMIRRVKRQARTARER